MKMIFMGTPDFGAIILEELVKNDFKPVLVITETDKPIGREQIITPPPVKVLAQKYDIPVLQPLKISDTKYKLLDINPDLIIVAAYGKIIPKEILDIPKYGCLNVHPSLLPKWRGASPIQYTILSGDEETGVSIMLMDEKMDHGPILVNSKLKIQNPKLTTRELKSELADLGVELLIEVIPQWVLGKIKTTPQDDSKATYTKIIKKDDGKINWNKGAEEIERQIRAFDGWPESFTFWEKSDKLLRIKILKARVLKSNEKENYPIGKVLVVPQNDIGIQCGKDFLVIEKLQLEGKNEIDAEDFLRGYQEFAGTILK